jgi:hypothetical protein
MTSFFFGIALSFAVTAFLAPALGPDPGFAPGARSLPGADAQADRFASEFEENFPKRSTLLSRAIKAGHALHDRNGHGRRRRVRSRSDPSSRRRSTNRTSALPLKDALNNLAVRMPRSTCGSSRPPS